MTETKVQSLERGINSKLNIPLNAKICLKVEELLRKTWHQMCFPASGRS